MKNKHGKNVELFKNRLRFLKYADNTIDSYSYYLKLFLEFTDKRITHITLTDAYVFLDICMNKDNSAKNQVISSIKLFYLHILNKNLDMVKMQRPRKKKRLPRVIDAEKLEHRLSKIKNIKHRAILELGYRCGLRVSEVCNVKIKDIDSGRMLILIRDSKFSKDRYVPISHTLLILLRDYYKEYHPVEYLFNGQFGDRYSHSSCQNIFKKYIDLDKSFRSLRHSYGTTLVERNINMRIIQKSLGHASSKTTEIYTHVSNISLQQAAI